MYPANPLQAATFDARQFDPALNTKPIAYPQAAPRAPLPGDMWYDAKTPTLLKREVFVHGQDWALVWVFLFWGVCFGALVMFGVAHVWKW